MKSIRLITLNIWGGHVHKPLLQFIAAHRDVDIFCLQEVYHKAPASIGDEERYVRLDIFNDIQLLLPDHQGFFQPVVQGIYGLAAFVKKSLAPIEEGIVDIHHNPDYPGKGPAHHRILQWLKIGTAEQMFYVLNVHGLWNGQGKTDTPARLQQSNNIRAFMDTITAPKILCGDFNLRPDTESLAIVAEGMNDWIAQRGIQSTRTSLYPKAEKFADYIFTSPDVEVIDFQVLPDEVSDHAPLLVEFSAGV